MDSSLHITNFPPLASSSAGGVRSSPKDWSQVFATEHNSPKAFSFSHFPSEPEVIPFSGDKLQQGGEDWKLCLVGYSIGRRPYYEALLGAIKKTWSLKGSVQLLSLNDGFFLFKFSCNDDYEMVWTRGVWFLLGKPFVLQKWHPKFTPTKEDFTSVPIWVKIHDLTLACWNSEGISRIASKIGVPLAADSLTEQKTRLTYARICVLVDRDATYPEEIKVSLDGDIVCLKVQYEWRPYPCNHCKSLMHLSASCPTIPEKERTVQVNDGNSKRGRSNSRKPRFRSFSNSMIVSTIPEKSVVLPNLPPNLNVVQSSSEPTIIATDKSPTINAVINELGMTSLYQPHSPKLHNPLICSSPPKITISEDNTAKDIPNLNSPQEAAASSSNGSLSKSSHQENDITSPNKFGALNIEEDTSLQTEVLVRPVNVMLANNAEGNSDKNNKANEKAKPSYVNVVSKKSAKGKEVKKPQIQLYS
ncbi:RNA exonuclease 1 [Dendrobium catenatum]|uniref:RNA exonuclease 1 n=1 Tax=Dendrobium catenatum TaxID=906689 RepID=A0A2I0VFE2_9ASPA|nr:RNA exonuclease 1 [Dendrobium catenatum]